MIIISYVLSGNGFLSRDAFRSAINVLSNVKQSHRVINITPADAALHLYIVIHCPPSRVCSIGNRQNYKR